MKNTGLTIKVFLDTSALFAGIWSAKGGARLVLKLGEAGVINLLVSPNVLSEIERVIKRKAPNSLGALTLLLDQSRIEVAAKPNQGMVKKCLILTSHLGDAQILAAAWDSQSDFFVTLDRQHFLNNNPLREGVPFKIGTPGDFLAWYRNLFAY